MQKVFEKQFVSARELAARFDVSLPTIWRWRRVGKLPAAAKIGSGTTRWRLSDIEQWAALKCKDTA